LKLSATLDWKVPGNYLKVQLLLGHKW